MPEDVAIVGLHGLELGQFATPSLTSIKHARAELGELGARLLLDLIASPGSYEHEHRSASEQILPVELVVRESCGASRAGLPA